jgi:hypothetical protein
MHHIRTLTTATTHQLYRSLLVVAGRDRSPTDGDLDGDLDLDVGDRGAVSLEQVLWFVAAGISVAVIASILWSQIRSEAERPVDSPSSP